MGLMKDYFDAQRDAEAQFGPNAVVMMEIGSFMECYATETFGQAKRVASALNMTVTRKNKKFPVSDSNPYMMGFPNTAHEKNVPVLLAAGLTVIWLTQTVQDKTICRQRTRVLTPGTYAPLSEEGYHVCCVSSNGVVVAIDTSVGKVSLYSGGDLCWFRDTYNPVETLLVDCSEETRDLFKGSAQQFDNGNNYHDKVIRQAVIARAYADTTDIPEVFLVPLTKLLDFVWSCHPKALEHLEHPRMVRQDRVSLHNNLIPQLELVKSQRGPGLIFKLNQYAKTSMGRRALKRRLLCPFTEPEDIRRELDQVACWLKRDFTEEQIILECVPDMERALNQLLISPTMTNVCDFHEGLFHCLDLFENKELRQAFESVVDTQGQTFRKGYDEYLQELTQTKAELLEILENIVLKYDFFKNCKLENYQLITTKKRGESIVKNYPTKVTLRVVNANMVAVCTEKSETLLRDYQHVVHEISTRNTELLQRWVNEISETFVPELREVISRVTDLDCVLARALCAKENRLVCPEIRGSSVDQSYVRATNLRHPLIEGYIGNDCNLGNETPGVLLYGVNGSGKTCHAKSIAMNIILAQAGFYVHADRFELSPFTKIFARINCDDDLYSGLSSFSVEMTELRSILRLADAKSLIIGDELCKGTEDLSAVSLVAACVRHFHDHDVKFVFATHLHKLPELDAIKEARVAIKHVQCEHRNGEIIFKRKLADGQGDSMYGIEVARHLLGLPSVANHAMMIRNELIGRATGKIKKSNYNKKVIQDQCHVCQSTKDLHTHHIEFQKNFEKTDKNQRKKMNHKDNLMILCHTCHDKLHRGELMVEQLNTIGGRKNLVTKQV